MVNPTWRFALLRSLPVLICLAVSIPAFALPAAPKPATTPAPAPPATPFFPLTLTNGGVRVRVLDAKWVWPDELPQQASNQNYFYDKNIPVLAVWYDISPNPDDNDPNNPQPSPRLVLQTPDGDLTGTQSADPPHGPTARCAVFWKGADPRQPSLTLQLDTLRPDTPSGETIQETTFANLRLPSGVGATVKVGETQFTPNGTSVTVDNLSEYDPQGLSGSILDPNTLKDGGGGPIFAPPPGPPRLELKGHWTRPDNLPNMIVSFAPGYEDLPQVGEPILEDDLGEVLTQGGSFGQTFPRDSFSISSSIPSANASTVTLRVQLVEQAGNLEDSPAILHFPFSLPSAQIEMPTLRPAAIPTTPIASDTLHNGTLTVESITSDSRRPYGPGWHVWLHLAVPKPQTLGDQWQGAERVISTGLVAKTPYENIGPPTDWAADGSLLPPNEKRFNLQVLPEGDAKPPSKFDLTLDWREVVSQTQLLTFQAIPLPAPGTVAQMNRTVSAGTIGNFVLRKVGWYDLNNPQDQDTYQGRPNSDFMLPPTGLVVVIQCPAGETLGTENEFLGPDPLLALDFSDARDDHGVPLLWPDTLFGYDRSNRTVDSDMLTKSGGAVPNAITLFLLPPPPGAKYFRFDLRATERHALNSATTTFSALPLPPLPKD